MTRVESPREGRFSSRDRLESQIARLGLPIPLASPVREALKPASVAGRRVGNRFAIQPMEGCDGTAEGRPDELTVRRWKRFGASGAKILWGEATAVLPEARANPRQLVISERTVGDLARLAQAARAEHRAAWKTDDDFLVGLQLAHSGRFSVPKPFILFREPALERITPAGAELLPDGALDRLQDAYVAAAALAANAGFDFVDVKQCHGYLLSELLAARSRPGRYGGGLENRTLFAREVFRRIRSEAGPGLILATRINLYDGVPFEKDSRTGVGRPVPVDRPYRHGFGAHAQDPLRPDLSEPIEAIRMFREAGLQLVNASLGCPYYNFHMGRPADTPPADGYVLPEDPLVGVARHFSLAAAIQKEFPDLPVVGTGYSYLRQFACEAAEAQIAAGCVTFAGFGRAALAYPGFLRDLLDAGAMDPKRSCITVSRCTDLMRSKGNALGQFAAGCVPRDKVYAKLYQEARKRESGVGSRKTGGGKRAAK